MYTYVYRNWSFGDVTAFIALWILFSLHMCRNSYLWAGEHSDTKNESHDPDLLTGCYISAISGHVQLIFHWTSWKSTIFRLLVYLTYWPRKHVIRIVPQGDYFHKVWSWFDRPLHSYNILLQIRYVTKWPWPLTFVSGHICLVTWSTCLQTLRS